MRTEPHTTDRAATGPRHETADVIVVGARCAGAATAMLLARAGHDVLVVDRASFPSDTLSTHAIARGGVVQLQRWGLLDTVVESGAPPIRTVEFHAGDVPTVRVIKQRHGVDFLVAPRRHVLDPILQDRAVADGARLRTGTTVTGVIRSPQGRVIGVTARDAAGPVELRAQLVIGADGLRSRIAKAVDAPMIERRSAQGSTYYAYYAGNWPAMEYHLSDQGFAGVFPTHGGEACIWVCAPDGFALGHRRRARSIDAALAAMIAETAPDLSERLHDAVATSAARGMSSLPNQLLDPVGAGWALVGDAGYHRDAITGHGISDAFRDADLLATAVDAALRSFADERDALAGYRSERDRMLREVFEITCEMSQHPSLPRFAELQRELAAAIDRQAGELAGRPLPAATAA